MSAASPRVYLLDIEGTVAPIAFVYEQLFPYARAHVSDFLKNSAGNANVEADLALLAEENRDEDASEAPRIPTALGAPALGAPALGAPALGAPGPASGTWEGDDPLNDRHPERHTAPETCHPERAKRVEGPANDCHPERAKRVEGPAFRDQALTYLLWLMDHDRKSTALKSLQGKIWKVGFESGQLKGTLFADVPAALKRWAARAKVAIYSSGSIEAQQLLFRHSIYGDLTGLIAANFDTRTGPKQASASYAAIAADLNVAPDEVLFFSDVVRELNAARQAGLQTRLVVREGNAVVDDTNGHPVLESFDII
jgi:2,3-diketo-5-methylthio-1-phosphopentane phosphatase